MAELFPGYSFPTRGWKHAGSNSYGEDMLYRGLEHVLVRLFPESEQATAYGTHHFLKELGVSTADIQKIRHVDDGKFYYYVFASRDEMLALLQREHPDLTLEVQRWRRVT